jgi:hypothetical protein
MRAQTRTLPGLVRTAAVLLMLSPGCLAIHAQTAAPASKAVVTPVANPADFPSIQEQLLKLLRLSPTLTEVVARDPSLLSNQDYVVRNNPELAQFLQSHPEVARNPGFYLFTKLPPGQGRTEDALERKVWPELQNQYQNPTIPERIADNAIPFMVFLGILGSLLWLIHVFLENRRWGRIFKLQTDVHGKLIDKFASNQELLNYMETEAGKRFLEAAPIPVNFDQDQRVPNAVARVLTPLQIGVVSVLLGSGLLFLRSSLPDYVTPLLVFGTIALMPGIGFILSAGITWVLAERLGLMPDRRNGSTSVTQQSDPRERQ